MKIFSLFARKNNVITNSLKHFGRLIGSTKKSIGANKNTENSAETHTFETKSTEKVNINDFKFDTTDLKTPKFKITSDTRKPKVEREEYEGKFDTSNSRYNRKNDFSDEEIPQKNEKSKFSKGNRDSDNYSKGNQRKDWNDQNDRRGNSNGDYNKNKVRGNEYDKGRKERSFNNDNRGGNGERNFNSNNFERKQQSERNYGEKKEYRNSTQEYGNRNNEFPKKEYRNNKQEYGNRNNEFQRKDNRNNSQEYGSRNNEFQKKERWDPERKQRNKEVNQNSNRFDTNQRSSEKRGFDNNKDPRFEKKPFENNKKSQFDRKGNNSVDEDFKKDKKVKLSSKESDSDLEEYQIDEDFSDEELVKKLSKKNEKSKEKTKEKTKIPEKKTKKEKKPEIKEIIPSDEEFILEELKDDEEIKVKTEENSKEKVSEMFETSEKKEDTNEKENNKKDANNDKPESKKKEHIYGIHSVESVLQKKNRKAYTLYVVNSHKINPSEKITKIVNIATSQGLEISYLTKGKLDSYSNHRPHNGVVLACETRQYIQVKLYNEFKSLLKKEKGNLVLVLDQVTDPQNLGSILRSSLFLGTDFVILNKKNCPPISPAVAKVSSGASELLDLYNVKFLKSFLEDARTDNWKIVSTAIEKEEGTVLDIPVDENQLETEKKFESEKISLDELKIKNDDNLIVILGSEASGVSDNLFKVSNYQVMIPPHMNKNMLGVSPFDIIDSLNVGVTTGIMLNHIKYLQKQDEIQLNKL